MPARPVLPAPVPVRPRPRLRRVERGPASGPPQCHPAGASRSRLNHRAHRGSGAGGRRRSSRECPEPPGPLAPSWRNIHSAMSVMAHQLRFRRPRSTPSGRNPGSGQQRSATAADSGGGAGHAPEHMALRTLPAVGERLNDVPERFTPSADISTTARGIIPPLDRASSSISSFRPRGLTWSLAPGLGSGLDFGTIGGIRCIQPPEGSGHIRLPERCPVGRRPGWSHHDSGADVRFAPQVSGARRADRGVGAPWSDALGF